MGQQFGAVAPGIVQNTTDVLFRDLWLRPYLAPRDRSLVTVSALIASGQVAQLPGHLNRAMDNGLTQTEAAEVITHLAFYAGWPNAFSALPVAKDVFEKRPKYEENPHEDLHRASWRCLCWIRASDSSQAITVTRSGAQPSRQGPAENFTGSVRIDPLFSANPPSRVSGGRVTLSPVPERRGTRTRWVRR